MGRGVWWWKELLEAGLGRSHMVGGAVGAGPCGRAGRGPGLLAAAAVPPHSTRSRTRARGPGHPGGRPPRPAQASRSGAQRAGSGRGRRAATEDPSLGPAEVSVAKEVAGRRRRGPVGAFVCGAQPQSRRLPSRPPRSRISAALLVLGRGVLSPSARSPASQLGAQDASSRRGQAQVALAKPGRGTTCSFGHTPGGPCA